MVVTGTDTEEGFLTTTAYGNVVVLAESPLGDGVAPVGIVVVLLVFRERRVVVQFRDIGGGIALLRIEVTLLQQHGVVVTRQQIITLWLVGTCQFQGVLESGFTTGTTLGGEFDDTVTTLRTVDGRSGSILQHADVGDILRVDIQQLSETLVVGCVHIKRREVYGTHVTVDNDQRVGIGQGRQG